MDDLNTATADRYRVFAEWARGVSPPARQPILDGGRGPWAMVAAGRLLGRLLRVVHDSQSEVGSVSNDHCANEGLTLLLHRALSTEPYSSYAIAVALACCCRRLSSRKTKKISAVSVSLNEMVF